MNYSLTLITNMLDPHDLARIVEGPFGFDTEAARRQWQSRFERALERENLELILPPGSSGIQVEYSKRFRADASAPISVPKAIKRLRNFWDTYVHEATPV